MGNFKKKKIHLVQCPYPYESYALSEDDVVVDLVTWTEIPVLKSDKTPYKGMSLVKTGDKITKTVTLHRLKAYTFLENNTGLPFEECQVDHLDGDKLNNELSNLEIVIPQENKARAYRTGLRKDNDPTTLVNSETGEEHMFYSQTEAARFLNSSSGSISYQIKMKNNIMLNIHRQNYQLHPFHLVDNSPWPIFTSFTLFGLAMNSALTMHGYIGTSLWVVLNIITLVYVMFLWFRDIVSEGTYLGNHTVEVRNGINLGFILFIVSETLFFIGIFWAFGHSAIAPTVEIGAIWPPLGIEAIGPTDLPLLNTLLLLSSGATLTYSHHYLINGNRYHALLGLFITIALAVIFMICQYIEYITSSFTIADGVFGSVFYMGTGFHGLHVLVGIIMLSISYWRIWNYHSTKTHHLGFHTSVLYYHFVDVVWLFLFILFYWWGS